MQVNFQSVWQNTVQFVRREAGLLTPLALATLALGQAAIVVTQGMMGAGGPGSLSIFLFVGWLLITLGQLSITALVLKPGSTVGDAIGLGIRALPRMIVIFAWLLLAIFLISTPLVYLMSKDGFDANKGLQGLTSTDLLILLPLIIFAIWFAVRSYFLNAVLVDQGKPAALSLAAAFRFSKGKSGVILPIMLMFLLAGQFVQLIAAALSTLIIGGIMSAIGAASSAIFPVALVTGMAAAFPATLASVFSAMLYRQLTSSG